MVPHYALYARGALIALLFCSYFFFSGFCNSSCFYGRELAPVCSTVCAGRRFFVDGLREIMGICTYAPIINNACRLNRKFLIYPYYSELKIL